MLLLSLSFLELSRGIYTMLFLVLISYMYWQGYEYFYCCFGGATDTTFKHSVLLWLSVYGLNRNTRFLLSDWMDSLEFLLKRSSVRARTMLLTRLPRVISEFHFSGNSSSIVEFRTICASESCFRLIIVVLELCDYERLLSMQGRIVVEHPFLETWDRNHECVSPISIVVLCLIAFSVIMRSWLRVFGSW